MTPRDKVGITALLAALSWVAAFGVGFFLVAVIRTALGY